MRQFVADACHELRTPLASIRGYAELTRREREPVPADGQPTRCRRVESEALRMPGLVEDLLLLARLDAGRPLDREPVDLSLLAIDAVSDAHAAAPDHRWELDLPDEPVEVRRRPGPAAPGGGQPARQRPHAHPCRHQGRHLRAARRRWVRLTVADDGPGVPEAAAAATSSQRFTRGDDSRNRAAGSTGLGLSIVDAVAKSHGGRVELAEPPRATRPSRSCSPPH